MAEHRVSNDRQEISREIDVLVKGAQEAQKQFFNLDQEKVDQVVKAIALAGLDHHMELAKLAVEETGRGVYEDKIAKNIFATESIYHSIKYHRTVGIIHDNEEEDYMEVAEPVGVIAGITPVTNPSSTTMFKCLIAMKTRNPIIFSFHPGSIETCIMAARIMRDAAVMAGAPQNCISWIEKPSLEATQMLMNHLGVELILATGGESMVRSAYSAGKPALGVGPGNVPCYIEQSANLKRAVTDIILSKTFDNGMICASEQGLFVDKAVSHEVMQLLQENRCYFLAPDEIKRVEELATCEHSCSLNPDIVGQSAYTIAQMAGVSVPQDTKMLVAVLEGIGPEFPLSREKLSPILAYYTVNDYQEGISRSEEMVEFGGLGHSAVIHSDNQEVINKFAERIRVGRIIVNSPATHGAIGELYNTNMPSLTLGCGSMGHNSTTNNVSAVNLVNVKRVARRRVKMQWFRVPERIYFESGSIQYLTKMPNVHRAIIVCDPAMVEHGYVDKVLYHIYKRSNHVSIEVFSDVEPDPSVETVMKGRDVMRRFQPDTIIALGGGSALDAAKGMWLFYEHPDVEFEFLKLKFMDIRKRTYKYPKLGRKASFVAIPTTSGTGSEVTAFAVITDKGHDIKYPLADYELTPDVAIIDFEFVMTVPPAVTADTGMDVLTHAIESYVSVMASDYTDGLALKAIELVFEYLPRAYRNGADREAREKMHNASTIAGMAFTNAFLGINHSLAHKLGGEFHIPHGRANAILLPHVIEYNAQLPTKFTSWPKYEYYVAHQKYQKIARYLGLPAGSVQEGVYSLIQAVRGLSRALNVPITIGECGVNPDEFLQKVPLLAEKAFEDQTTTSNPRMPLIEELKNIYIRAFGPPLSSPDIPGPEVPTFAQQQQLQNNATAQADQPEELVNNELKMN